MSILDQIHYLMEKGINNEKGSKIETFSFQITFGESYPKLEYFIGITKGCDYFKSLKELAEFLNKNGWNIKEKHRS